MSLEARRITLLTRNVDFTIKAKLALEKNGAYFVSAFTRGDVALKFLEENPQEIVILDLTVRDIPPEKLIQQARAHQPNARIAISPSHPAVLAAVASLDVQGVMDIPMPIRQLFSFLKRLEAVPTETKSQPVIAKREEEALPPVENEAESPTTDRAAPAITEADLLTDELFQRLAAEEPPMPDFEESATVRDLISNMIKLEAEQRIEEILGDPAPDAGDAATPEPAAAEEANTSEEPNVVAQVLETAMDTSTPVNGIVHKVKEKIADAQETAGPALKEMPEEELPALPRETLEYTAPTTTFSKRQQPEQANDLDTDRLQPIARSRPVIEGDFPSLADLESYQSPISTPAASTGTEKPPDDQPSATPPTPAAAAAPSSRAARMALMLTELSLETTAEALILSRDDELIDYRGRLPRAEVEQLKDLLFAPWNENQKTRINFPRLESVATDFMLYSMRTTDNLVLSLLFAGVMPFSAIRRQGKKLADALNAVPDTPATETIPEPPTSSLQAPETPAVPAAETPALETLLEPADESGSEPSGAVPATIRLEPLISEEEVDTTPGDDEEEEGPVVPAPQPGEDPTIAARDDAGVELEEDSAQAPAAPEETALATEAYNFVWLLRDNTLTLTNEAAESVVSTLNKRLSQDGWRIRNLDVYGDFIYLRADVPTTQPANRAVRDAMQYSAEILQTAQSTWDDSIWADSYLVVPAERELTIKEIQNFLAFARN